MELQFSGLMYSGFKSLASLGLEISWLVDFAKYAGMYSPGETTWYSSLTDLTPEELVTFAVMKVSSPDFGNSGVCLTCRMIGIDSDEKVVFTDPGEGLGGSP